MLIDYTQEPAQFNGRSYDQRHGGAFDRGAADSYYNRPRDPHMYPNGTYNPPRIGISLMSTEEIDAYHAGYDYNDALRAKKEWY